MKIRIFILFLFAIFIHKNLNAVDLSILKSDRTTTSLKNPYSAKIYLDNYKNKDLEVVIFKRNSWTWFVFNQDQENIEEILNNKTHLYTQHEIIQNNNFLIFRIKNKYNHFPTLTITESDIEIDFAKTDNSTTISAPNINHKQVEFEISNKSGKYVEITDPDIHDKILVLPTKIKPITIENYNKISDFNILDSCYGIAINAISDQIELSIKENKSYLYYPESEVRKLLYTPDINTPIFQFKTWFNDNKDFQIKSKYLKNKIIKEQSLESRLNLVKFFLGHKMTQEALSYLNYITKTDQDAYKSYNFKFLYIASLYFSKAYYQALNEIRKISTEYMNHEQIAETVFWYNIINIKLGDDNTVIDHNQFDFIKHYSFYEIDFALLALKQAIINQKTKIVEEIEQFLNKQQLSKYQHNTFMLLMADKMMLTGQHNEAIAIYEAISLDRQDNYNKSAAILNRTTYLYKNNMLNYKKAIDELEKARVLVRNEDIEAELLETLGDIYIENQEYSKGLSLFKKIHLRSSEHKNVIQINKKINRLLTDLFKHNIVDNMLPLEVIDIFINFYNLLPIGRTGLEISLNFTAYLIKVNLISEATDFLKHLVKYRLRGKEKKECIIKLANLYFLNKKPKKIIELFYDYDINTKEAIYLQSHSFLKLGEHKIALALLINDTSEEADSIRANIFWESNNWQEIINLLEPKLQYRLFPQKDLTQNEQKYVFYLAVAYFQDNNTRKLKGLYDAFKDMNLNNQKIIEILEKILSEDQINQKYLAKIYDTKLEWIPQL